MSRGHRYPALLTATLTALLAACGTQHGGDARPGSSTAGASEYTCFWFGTAPMPTPTAPGHCPKPSPTPPAPTPTVTMTPHTGPEGWSAPSCTPERDDEAVTRSGTHLRCGHDGTWRWLAATSPGERCTDEGAWNVIHGGIATVCRDGTWHLTKRKTSPSATEPPTRRPVGKVPYPPPLDPTHTLTADIRRRPLCGHTDPEGALPSRQRPFSSGLTGQSVRWVWDLNPR